MEGVWLGPLIKIYIKALFGMEPKLFQKSIFLHFVRHGTSFYDKYITYDDKKKYIDDNGSRIFPKQNIRNIYNAKYQETYSNQYYVLKINYIKYTRIYLDAFRNKTK